MLAKREANTSLSSSCIPGALLDPPGNDLLGLRDEGLESVAGGGRKMLDKCSGCSTPCSPLGAPAVPSPANSSFQSQQFLMSALS